MRFAIRKAKGYRTNVNDVLMIVKVEVHNYITFPFEFRLSCYSEHSFQKKITLQHHEYDVRIWILGFIREDAVMCLLTKCEM